MQANSELKFYFSHYLHLDDASVVATDPCDPWTTFRLTQQPGQAAQLLHCLEARTAPQFEISRKGNVTCDSTFRFTGLISHADLGLSSDTRLRCSVFCLDDVKQLPLLVGF